MNLIGKYSIKSFVLVGLALFFTMLILNSFFTAGIDRGREGMTTDASDSDPTPTDASGAQQIEVKHMDDSDMMEAMLKHMETTASIPVIQNSEATAASNVPFSTPKSVDNSLPVATK